MAFCTACGQPSDAAARFCTTCGAPFQDAPFPDAPFPGAPGPGGPQAGEPAPEEDDAFGSLFAPRRDAPGNRNDTARLPPVTAPGGPAGGGPAGGGGAGGWTGGAGGGWPGPGWEGGPGHGWTARPGPSRTGRGTIIAAVAGAVVVVAVVAAVLGFEMHVKSSPSPQGSSAQTPASGRVSPSSTPSAPNALVTVAPGAAGKPDTTTIVKLLTSYFTAINSHDYTGYQALLDPKMRRSVTLARFAAGYRSTTDSAATLTGISAAPDGQTTANVTFTSHQNPSDGPDHSPCTTWDITLFLQRSPGGFLIGPAPPGYHAAHHSCGG